MSASPDEATTELRRTQARTPGKLFIVIITSNHLDVREDDARPSFDLLGINLGDVAGRK